jgi:hypothetical protein
MCATLNQKKENTLLIAIQLKVLRTAEISSSHSFITDRKRDSLSGADSARKHSTDDNAH